MLTDQLPEIFLEAINQVDEDEEDLAVALDDDPMISDPRTKAFLESKTGKRVAGIVGWLARSKIAKKVAETDFAKKGVRESIREVQKNAHNFESNRSKFKRDPSCQHRTATNEPSLVSVSMSVISEFLLYLFPSIALFVWYIETMRN